MNPRQEFTSLVIMVELSLPKNSKITKGKSLVKEPKNQFVLTFIDGIENRETTQALTNSISKKKTWANGT